MKLFKYIKILIFVCLAANFLIINASASVSSNIEQYVDTMGKEGNNPLRDKLNDDEILQYFYELPIPELRILRNAFFAKYGYDFKSEDLKVYFSKFHWYKPRTRKVELTAVEKQDVAILKEIEDAKNRGENIELYKFFKKFPQPTLPIELDLNYFTWKDFTYPLLSKQEVKRYLNQNGAGYAIALFRLKSGLNVIVFTSGLDGYLVTLNQMGDIVSKILFARFRFSSASDLKRAEVLEHMIGNFRGEKIAVFNELDTSVKRYKMDTETGKIILDKFVDHYESDKLVWLPSTRRASIGPWKGLEKTVLALEYEEIVINDEIITAKHIISNSSNKAHNIKFGLPVKLFKQEEYDLQYIGKIEVLVNEEPIFPTFTKDLNKDYTNFIQWETMFQPNIATEIIIKYPSDRSIQNKPFEEAPSDVFAYKIYIGSDWPKPIKKLTIKYCDQSFYKLIGELSHKEKGYWLNDGWAHIDNFIRISPFPYNIDNDNACFVWDRSDWQPSSDDDNFTVLYVYDHEIYDVWWSEENEMGLILDNWCGIDEKTKGKHFAEHIGFVEKKLDDYFLLDMEEKAYFYGTNKSDHYYYSSAMDGEPDTIDTNETLPAHLRTDFQLLLLRYLRNYYFAIHGHKFKDEKLAECFQGIPQRKEWTQVERDNVKTITIIEEELRKENKKEWVQVNINLR